MASSAARRPAARTRTRRPARRAGVGTQAIGMRGIRWDRVARLSLLIALGLVLLLYIRPAARYIDAWQLSRDTNGELHELRSDNATLRARARELRRPSRVELEARRLGMARPGERAYVVRGLPK